MSKFNNQKTEVDGILFDSRKEAKRYYELKLLQRAGEISNLQLQVKYELIPKQANERACNYIADFVYQDKSGQIVVEDVKGRRTKEYVIKRKLMLYQHGIRVVEV